MAEHPSVQSEPARRNLILYSALAAAAIAAGSAVPEWWRTMPRHGIDLVMQAVPPTSAAALLAGLCIGFVSLSPNPRLTFVTAVTFPAMHIAMTYTLAQLLAARQSALVEPLPQQLPIQAWLLPTTYLGAFGAELVVFLLAAGVTWLAGHRSSVDEC